MKHRFVFVFAAALLLAGLATADNKESATASKPPRAAGRASQPQRHLGLRDRSAPCNSEERDQRKSHPHRHRSERGQARKKARSGSSAFNSRSNLQT